jgi:hypothetical protein
MGETKLEKLARLSGEAASKALGALERRGYDIRGKLSAPISRVPRRDSAKPKSAVIGMSIVGKPVHQNDRPTVRRAAFLVGDVGNGSADGFHRSFTKCGTVYGRWIRQRLLVHRVKRQMLPTGFGSFRRLDQKQSAACSSPEKRSSTCSIIIGSCHGELR